MNTVGRLLGQILRFLFAWIDAIVTWVITEVYNLLIQLSELVLYSDNIVKTVGLRIGLLLGIFMLFRIAISLVDYMISPDKVRDNAKGGGKLVINVIVSLVLLVTINIIFEQAYKIQVTIVDSHIIEKIFFGEKSNTNVDIGYYLYTGFFTPNTDVFGNSCNDLWDLQFDLNGDEGKECDDKLFNLLDDSARKDIYNARNYLQMSNVFSNYNLILATVNNDFAFNYIPILSSAAGIIVLLVLISFSMDLATRAIKLLFLQIIAPIPIIYNIDPGKGKDVFQKWYKECFSTYLSVFLRLIAINFAVFMIVLVKGNFKDVFANNWLLNVFIIIGCLIFAKQVPKLLEDVLGIKTDGMALNPLKKFQEQALFGKQITAGVAGVAGAGLAGAAAFGANAIATDGNFIKRLGSGIAGSTSATFRGLGSTLKGQKFGQVYSGAYKGAITARNNRASRQALDVKPSDVWLNNMRQKLGMDTTAEEQDAEIKVYDEYNSSAETAISVSETELDKNDSRIQLASFNGYVSSAASAGITGITLSGGNQIFSTLAELREASSDSVHYSASDRAILQEAYNKIRSDIAENIREETRLGTIGAASQYEDGLGQQIFNNNDASISTIKGQMDNAADIVSRHKDMKGFIDPNTGNTFVVDGAGIKKASKQAKSVSTNIKNSAEYRQAHKVQEQANREKK